MTFDPDLTSHRCFERYCHGYYPHFDRDVDTFYWQREPTRAVVPIDSRSVNKAKRLLKESKEIIVTRNEQFDAILSLLTDEGLRPTTWVKNKVVDVYRALYAGGHILTYEAWHEGKLVGGLLAVALPHVIAAETMIQTMSNASKACVCSLLLDGAEKGRRFVDVQVPHPAGSICHRLGEIVITIERYVEILGGATGVPSRRLRSTDRPMPVLLPDVGHSESSRPPRSVRPSEL